MFHNFINAEKQNLCYKYTLVGKKGMSIIEQVNNKNASVSFTLRYIGKYPSDDSAPCCSQMIAPIGFGVRKVWNSIFGIFFLRFEKLFIFIPN